MRVNIVKQASNADPLCDIAADTRLSILYSNIYHTVNTLPDKVCCPENWSQMYAIKLYILKL